MSANNESPAALPFARDDIVLHKKTQRTYRVLGRCIIEATLADCYMYRGSDGRTWIRPVAEMEDGRFVLIESTAPGASESRGSVPEPTPPAVASGEPPDWAIAQAFCYFNGPPTLDPGNCECGTCKVYRKARELARSAAAKGEG